MAVLSTKKLEKSIVELEIQVDRDAFQAGIQQAFKKNAPKMTIPGFRKGKAPRAMLEQFYGKTVFYEDAVNLTFGEAYDAAVAEQKLDVVGKGDVEIISIDDNGYTFKALIPVRPEVTLGAYKNLTAEKRTVCVTDEETEAELTRLQQRSARLVAVTDRAAQLEDTVTIDYAGSVDGEAFAGGTAEKQQLKLGSGQFIPGFEDQIVGKNIGDSFDVNVTFPEEYHANELAGKAAVFACKLHEIQVTELPALDDEFAKDVSEFDTIDALKKDISDKLLARKETESQNEFEESLIDQIIEGMKADVPDAMIEGQIDQIIQDFQYRLSAQGLDLKTYLSLTGGDETALRETFREQATKRTNIRLALEQIAIEEKIEATEEDMEAEYKKLSEQYGTDVETCKKFIPAEELKKDVVVSKAIELVKSSAAVVEKKDEAPKKAAKKTADKPKTTKKKAETEEAAEKPAKKTASKTTKTKKTEE